MQSWRYLTFGIETDKVQDVDARGTSNSLVPAGMSGFSMGGVHASMVASLFPYPVACTPLLAPRSASVAFCSGALWDATAWKPLLSPEDQNQRVGLPLYCIFTR